VKPLEIKAEIIRKGHSLTSIADEAEASVSEVSRCISGDGLYQKIRVIIAERLEKPIEEIFDKKHPKPHKRVSWCKAA